MLYFGDQIYNDLADLTLNYGWRTGAILYELSVRTSSLYWKMLAWNFLAMYTDVGFFSQHEIKISNSEEFRHTASWLQTLQHLIADMQDSPDIQVICSPWDPAGIAFE